MLAQPNDERGENRPRIPLGEGIGERLSPLELQILNARVDVRLPGGDDTQQSPATEEEQPFQPAMIHGLRPNERKRRRD